MKKWNLDWENDSCENFTREQQMQNGIGKTHFVLTFKPCLKVKTRKYYDFWSSMVLIQEGDKSEEAIIETFNILRTFFNDKKELRIMN